MAVNVIAYAPEQIVTLDDFTDANDLTAEIVETRDGQWFARLNAFLPPQQDQPRQQISTKQFATQELAQGELAAILTKSSRIIHADGEIIDVGGIRVTP